MSEPQLERLEPPQEIWLVKMRSFWIEAEHPNGAVRYVRPPITTPQPQEHQVINGVDVCGFRIINCECGWIGQSYEWENHL